jgi:tRNA-dihydrouridine synthase 3
MTTPISDPVEPDQSLKRPPPSEQSDTGSALPGDSAMTKAEKVEQNRADELEEPSAKRVKLELQGSSEVGTSTGSTTVPDSRDKVRGLAKIKPEFLIDTRVLKTDAIDDDAAEGRGTDDRDRDDGVGGGKKNRKKKEKGQNKGRQFGSWYDAIKLCNSRANTPEFSPRECSFGDTCKCCHDLRLYLKDGRKADLTTFDGKCPVWEAHGICHAGWKCRFVGSHSKEVEREDGRKELVLIERGGATPTDDDENENRKGVYNVVTTRQKLSLSKRLTRTDKADQYTKWLDQDQKEMEKIYQRKKNESEEAMEENRAQFIDPPFLPSEKRKIYFGAETPVLAPLTTQGNLPFRRLCVELGAQLTYSEMAMTLPLVQGQKSEWALMKAHESEISPPRYKPTQIVKGYDNSKDLKFGAQVSANKPWQALKAAEAMSMLLPHLRVIDLNCGCPVNNLHFLLSVTVQQ